VKYRKRRREGKKEREGKCVKCRTDQKDGGTEARRKIEKDAKWKTKRKGGIMKRSKGGEKN